MSYKVRIQADDFFNAYQVLNEHGVVTMRPSVVCLAFSVELYIKDLHFALKGKAPRGHNILELFEKLPSQIRQKIFDHDSISQNPFNIRGNMLSPLYFSNTYSSYDRFCDQIKAISDGFEKWRYSYESTTLRYDESFALALIEAIKSVADSKRIRSAAQV